MPSRLTTRRTILKTLVGLSVVAVASPAFARRVVMFEILVENKVVLVGQMGDGGEAPDTVWSYLKSLEFEQPNPEYQRPEDRPPADFRIVPDAKDALRAKLEGKIRIFARYGGDVRLDSLELVRSTATSKKWRLADAEVARTAKLRKVDPAANVRK